MATVNTYTVGSNVARDYSTLSAWYSARAGNLVSNDYIEEAECYNDTDLDDSVTMNSSTTDEDHYLRIYTPVAERHSGIKDSGFQLAYTGGNTYVIQVEDDYVRVEGLEFDLNCRALYYTNISSDNELRVSHCVIDGNSIRGGMRINDANSVVKLSNNIIYGCAGAGVGAVVMAAADTVYIYNCTHFDNYYGVKNNTGSGATVIVKNTACFDSSQANGDFSGVFDSDSDYNCSSDTTAPGTHSLVSKTASDNFTNVTGGSEDLHIKNASADIYRTGTNLFSDADLAVTTDIDGDVRNYWDIGADGYGIGGGQVSNAFNLARRMWSIWKGGLVTIAGDCTLEDILTSFGDKATIKMGNPEIEFDSVIITKLDLVLGKRNRIGFEGITAGFLLDEDMAFSSSSSSSSTSVSSSSSSSLAP